MIAAGYPDRKILRQRRRNARAIDACKWKFK